MVAVVQGIIHTVKDVISFETSDAFPLTQAEVTAQEWLLPCLRKLHSVANDLAKQISRSRSFKRRSFENPDDDVLLELREEFIVLIHVSIARMIKATQAADHFQLPEIQNRKDNGLRMLQLLLKYDGSRLSDNFEVPLYLKACLKYLFIDV